MFKKIVDFFKSSFKSTPLQSATVVVEPTIEKTAKVVEMEQSSEVVEEPVKKPKRTKKKAEDTSPLKVVE